MITSTLEVGQLAPEFRLRGPGGQWYNLSDYRDRQNVVLVFYPLAFSPVCSHQLPDIQRHMDEFRGLDTVVFGVSVDSHYANEAFARSLHIEFPLLSDFKHQASTAYGVLEEDKGYSARATFVIDKQGRLVHKDISPNAGDRAQIPRVDQVLESLRTAQK
jgi:peroxiredoxin (alkyl hydroperoxide reductase subunit C)